MISPARPRTSSAIPERERRKIVIDAAKQVGPALFFSLLIIVVSFLPVFLLEAQEGRMFKPLAWTKTLAVGFSSLLAITLVPVLMIIFIKGKLRPESENPISRFTQALYLPVLRVCLKYRKTTLLLNLVFLAITFPLMFKLGSQFMPPLYEGSSLYMPTSLPGISITQASQLLQEQDRISVLSGSRVCVWRSWTLRQRDRQCAARHVRHDRDAQAARAMAGGHDLREIDPRDGREASVPGTQQHLDDASREPARHGAHGNQDTCRHEDSGALARRHSALGAKIQQVLSGIPQVRSVFAERVSQGFYVNVDVNRPEAAKYGLTIADVQQAVTSGIGGMNVAQNVEGRERYPMNVRYQRDFRDNPEELRRVLIATPAGAQIPIGQVAKISFSRGPAMIRDEDGQLTGYVYIDLNTKDYGGFVNQAAHLLRDKLQLPAGYTYNWSGEYEFQLRAKQRLKIILPVVFFVIFMLLYMIFHSVTEAWS